MGLRKAAEIALAALEDINTISKPPMGIPLPAEIDEAMDSLRQALAQEQKREWVGVTDEEIREIVCASKKPVPEDLKFMEDAVVKELMPLAKFLEAKLKEKNT